MKKIKELILPTVLVIISILLLSIHINKLFIGHHDWNGVVYGNVARNFIKYGYLNTHFASIANTDFVSQKDFVYSTHYPSLFPILVSVSFRLFGISEVSARLVPIIASEITLVLIYLLGTKWFGRDVGFIAGTLFLFSPFILYFGKMPVHEPLVLPFVLLFLWSYWQLLVTEKKSEYWKMVLFLILGGLINWPAFYIVLPTITHYIFVEKKQKFRIHIISLFFICVGMFLLHLLHMYAVAGSRAGGDISGIFLERINPYGSPHVFGFGFSKYFLQELQLIRSYFSTAILVFSVLWIVSLVVKWLFGHSAKKSDWMLMILFLFGMTELVVFSQLSFIHDYALYYLVPFFVLSGGVVFRSVLKYVTPLFHLRAVVCIVFIFLVAFERRSFVLALLSSNMNERGYRIGQLINQKTKSGQRTFIASNSYKEFQEVFIGYYADRNVSYGEKLPLNYRDYALIIRPKDHDPLSEAEKSFLDDHYVQNENQQFIWYFKK